MESSRASEGKDSGGVTPLRIPRNRTREQTPPPRDGSSDSTDSTSSDKVEAKDTKSAENAWVDNDEPPTSPVAGGEIDNTGMAGLPAPSPSVEVEHLKDMPDIPSRVSSSFRAKSPNAALGGVYFRQVMALLERKHQDIRFYEEVENHSIMRLDWASEERDGLSSDKLEVSVTIFNETLLSRSLGPSGVTC